MMPWSVELRLGRRYTINWSAPVIRLSSTLQSVLVLLAIIFSLGKESCKFCCEFNVELHGTDNDRELMALYNARRDESGLAEYDRSMSRLREAVHEALVQRFHDE